MANQTKESSFTCTSLIRMATRKIAAMSGLSKLLKFTSNSTHPAPKAPTVAATVTSSVSPHCAWVARQNYLRSRRLLTRTDVRARMSVWARIINWCRGGRRAQPEVESIFTLHP